MISPLEKFLSGQVRLKASKHKEFGICPHGQVPNKTSSHLSTWTSTESRINTGIALYLSTYPYFTIKWTSNHLIWQIMKGD